MSDKILIRIISNLAYQLRTKWYKTEDKMKNNAFSLHFCTKKVKNGKQEINIASRSTVHSERWPM